MTPGIALLLLLAADTPAQVPPSARNIGPAGCAEIRKEIKSKLRWCEGGGTCAPGTPKAAPLTEIARRFAPILWFSPNEPLLWADPAKIPESCSLEEVSGLPKISVPHALPDDQPASSPVVYYQVAEHDGPREAFDKDMETIDLTRVRRIELRYFFYYLCDIGANAHRHDLEAAQFTIYVVRDGDDFVLEPGKITGFAHGLTWVYNRLEVERPKRTTAGEVASRLQKAGDLLYPVTILVEEGKHASSPDRNGDGAFTPGYDVNLGVSEAWGIRDDFGSGLIVPKYHAEDTKRRDPTHRVYPGGIPDGDPLRKYYCKCSSPPEIWPPAGSAAETTYELRSALKAPATTAHPLGDGDFGDPPEVHDSVRETIDVIVHSTSLTLRWDQPSKQIVSGHSPKIANQLALTLPGLRPGPAPVWVAPRATFALTGAGLFQPQRFDLLVMPTASRWFDSYVSLWGIARGNKGQLLPEAGYRIRLVSKEPPIRFPRFLARYIPMVGLRIGLRLPSLARILGTESAGDASERARGARAVRLVAEIGGGAF